MLGMAPPPPPPAPTISIAEWEKTRKPKKIKATENPAEAPKPAQKKQNQPSAPLPLDEIQAKALARAARVAGGQPDDAHDNNAPAPHTPQFPKQALKAVAKTPPKAAPAGPQKAPAKNALKKAPAKTKAPAPQPAPAPAPAGPQKAPAKNALKKAPAKTRAPALQPAPAPAPASITQPTPQAIPHMQPTPAEAVPQEPAFTLKFNLDKKSILLSAGFCAVLYYLQNPQVFTELKKEYPAASEALFSFGQQALAGNAAQQLLPGQPANSFAFSGAFAFMHLGEALVKKAATELAKKGPFKKMATSFEKLSAAKKKNIKTAGNLFGWAIKTLVARTLANSVFPANTTAQAA